MGLLAVAQRLEKVAPEDEYFIKRKLYPNVDFYSGIMLRAIGIPTEMFTVLFAMARSVGWICQWREMISEQQLRISRPRQIYVGEAERKIPEDSVQRSNSSLSRGRSGTFEASGSLIKFSTVR